MAFWLSLSSVSAPGYDATAGSVPEPPVDVPRFLGASPAPWSHARGALGILPDLPSRITHFPRAVLTPPSRERVSMWRKSPAGWPPGWPSPGLVCQARRGARPHGGLSLSTSLILLCDSVVSGGCCSGLNPANNAAPKHARWSLLVVSLFSPAFACRKSAAPSSLWSLWRCGRLVSPRPRQR